MRRRPRLDSTHGEVVHALRQVGARVVSLAALGDDVPDLLVCWRGRLFLMEVKTPKQGKLSTGQSAFHASWPVEVVRSGIEAVEALVRANVPSASSQAP